MSANRLARSARILMLALPLAAAGCSWFTDFKQQPKIDPWDTPNDSTPPRGNPQGSVPVYGSAAPEFMYARNTQSLESMSVIANPTPVTQESVDRGRKAFQVNCAVCHGPAAMGLQTSQAFKFGIYAPSLAANSPAATQRTDGYIFAVIRNGKNLMPSYNRVEEPTRWDIVNYLRTLQGRTGLAADTSHGRPGETGQYLVGATISAPTRPAPYFAPRPSVPPATTTDTIKPPTPEAEK